MWLSKKKYRALISELDGIKAKQRELELKTEQKILNMAKRILREPGKLSEELNQIDRLDKYIDDIINH
jgi:hypothetical protein